MKSLVAASGPALPTSGRPAARSWPWLVGLGLAIVSAIALHRAADRSAAENGRLAERLRARQSQRTNASAPNAPEFPPLPPVPPPGPAGSVTRSASVTVRVPVAFGFDSYDFDELGIAQARALGFGDDALGLALVHVYSDSPSERAGLRDGDLLLKIDGQSVSSRNALEAILSRHAPQDAVVAEFRRSGNGLRTTIVLEPMMEVLPRACDRGDASACFAAGNRLKDGVAWVPRDPARAAGFFERACSGGREAACINLGRMLRNGDTGVPKNPARAAVLFERACDAGIPVGCHNLAILYGAGLGVLHDGERARELQVRACAGGDEDACSPSRREPDDSDEPEDAGQP